MHQAELPSDPPTPEPTAADGRSTSRTAGSRRVGRGQISCGYASPQLPLLDALEIVLDVTRRVGVTARAVRGARLGARRLARRL